LYTQGKMFNSDFRSEFERGHVPLTLPLLQLLFVAITYGKCKLVALGILGGFFPTLCPPTG